jgi:hypothetical protein
MKRLALILTLVAAPSAHAAKNPYTPQQVCGPNFSVIDSQLIRTPTVRLARTYLLYNAKTGRNCVATMKRYRVGKPSGSVGAIIQRQGSPRMVNDEGPFKYYAGPVKVRAPGQCIRWGGGMRDGTLSAGFMTDYEHCS